MSGMGKCKHCGQLVLWVTMASSGTANPLDPVPDNDGTIVVTEGIGRVAGSSVSLTEPTYRSHIGTCPKRGQPPPEPKRGQKKLWGRR